MSDQEKTTIKNKKMSRKGPSNGRWRGGISKTYMKRVYGGVFSKKTFDLPDGLVSKKMEKCIYRKIEDMDSDVFEEKIGFLGVSSDSLEECFVSKELFFSFVSLGFIPEDCENSQVSVGKKRLDWFIKELGVFIEYHPPYSYNTLNNVVEYAKRRREYLDEMKREEPLIVLLSLKDVKRFTEFLSEKLGLDKDYINKLS